LGLAILRRVRRGKSPFAPDKEHLHHKLMSWGNSQQRTAIILYLATAMLALPAMLSAFIPLWAALTSGFVLLAIAISITERNPRRSKKVKVKAKL
jgi:UDP-GlcNAc:undecaprenyl-phosphate GlcNAc-1-phosphate transferase